MIDPEFFLDEDLAKLTPHARLLYIGSWSIADDRAFTFPNRAGWIKAQIFPYEKVNICKLTNELIKAGKWILFRNNENEYIFIKNMAKYQRIDRPSNQKYPSYERVLGEDSTTTRPEVKLSEVKLSKVNLAETSSAKPVKEKKEKNHHLKQVIDHVCSTWLKKKGSKYHFLDKHAKLISGICRTYGNPEAMALWDLYLLSSDEFFKTCGYSIECFVTSMPKLVDQPYKSVARKYEKILYPEMKSAAECIGG